MDEHLLARLDGTEPRPFWARRPLRLVGLAVALLIVSTASIQPGVTQSVAAPAAAPARVTVSADQVKPSAPVSAMAVVSDMRVTSEGNRTILRLAATGPLTVEAFALAGPDRVVIDMPEVRFDLGGASKTAKGAIKAWRAGLFASGRSRLVLDTASPVRITASRTEARPDGRLDLIVELQSISAQEFDADERARREARLAAAAAERASAADTTPSSDAANHRLIIVLDPGHGGLDAGTVSPHTGMPEKQVVLEFSKLLEKKLAATGRYQVFLTRTDDTFVPLGDRVKFARAHHADLLVSIHANAELDRSVRGTTIFTRAEKATDAKAAALAAKENESDALAGVPAEEKSDDVADILIDLVKRETHAFSHAVAERLVDTISKSGHMVKQDPHRAAQLRVLNAYDFPSVLIELGFLSNKEDEAELVSPKWRDTTANSIVAAIDRFFANRDALDPK